MYMFMSCPFGPGGVRLKLYCRGQSFARACALLPPRVSGVAAPLLEFITLQTTYSCTLRWRLPARND